MEQIVAVIGALLILAAYVGHQRGVLSRSHAAYHWMNFVGAVVLTVVAYRAQQWGFVLLEGVWAAVSVPPLLRRTPEPGS
ncbi:MAG: CBU_0592 family membrane protein [Candidatus Rokuibacteriota bacterium]